MGLLLGDCRHLRSLRVASSIVALSFLGQAAQADLGQWSSTVFGLADPQWEPLGARADIANRLGVNLIRKVMRWHRVEPAPGIYDWAYADQIVLDAERSGMTLMFILSYGNKNYTGVEVNPPRTPQAIAAFANFARKCVERYKSKGILWEIWNEPNSDRFWGGPPDALEYAQLLGPTVSQMRRGDPNAVILAPSITGFDLPWLEKLLTYTLPDDIDYFSIHPYSPDAPESAAVRTWVQIIQDRIYSSKLGNLPPLLISEWSYLAPLNVSAALQGQSQSRIPLVSPFLVDTMSVFFGIQGPGGDSQLGEGSAGLIDSLGKPRNTYGRMLFLKPHVAGAQLVGRFRAGAGSKTWATLLRSATNKPTILVWTESGLSAAPIVPGASTYQMGQSNASFRTVGSASLGAIVASTTPTVVSSTPADLLWGPLASLGRLPNTLQIGYSKTRMEVARQIYDAIRNSRLTNATVFEIRSGTDYLRLTAGSLRSSSFGSFLAQLESKRVVLGNVTGVERPLSLTIAVSQFPAVTFDLGPNRWPAPIKYQVRSLEGSAVLLGTKALRLEGGAGFSLKFGSTAPQSLNANLVPGASVFKLGLGSSATKRTAHSLYLREQKVGYYGISAGLWSSSLRDIRTWSFDKIRPTYADWLDLAWMQSRGTCSYGMTTDATAPTGSRVLRLVGTSLVNDAFRVLQGRPFKLPTGAKRVDMWVYPTGPITHVDFSVRNRAGAVSYLSAPVGVLRDQWNLVQMTVPSVGSSEVYLHDIIRVFGEEGARASDMRLNLSEIRIYG